MRGFAVGLGLVVAGFAFVPAAWAAGPAFDCAKAESSAEKLVCSNDDLGTLDQKLADIYEGP